MQIPQWAHTPFVPVEHFVRRLCLLLWTLLPFFYIRIFIEKWFNLPTSLPPKSAILNFQIPLANSPIKRRSSGVVSTVYVLLILEVESPVQLMRTRFLRANRILKLQQMGLYLAWIVSVIIFSHPFSIIWGVTTDAKDSTWVTNIFFIVYLQYLVGLRRVK